MKKIFYIIFTLCIVSCGSSEDKKEKLSTETYVYLGSDNMYHSINSHQKPFTVEFSKDLSNENNLKVINGRGNTVALDSLDDGKTFFYRGLNRIEYLAKVTAHYDQDKKQVVKESLQEFESKTFAWELIATAVIFFLVFFLLARIEDQNDTEDSVCYDAANFFGAVVFICFIVSMLLHQSFSYAIWYEISMFGMGIFLTLASVVWIASWFVGIRNYYKPLIALVLFGVLSFCCFHYFDLSEYLAFYYTIIPASIALFGVYVYRYLQGEI